MFAAVIDGFLSKCAEQEEYARGIPAGREIQDIPVINKHTVWRLVVQKHPAERAGDHYDVRLVDDASGYAHSWATRKGIPEPGKKVMLFQQPTHTAAYSDYEGPLLSGYGKTRDGEIVEKVVDVPVEVTRSDRNLVRFNFNEGDVLREMLMVRDRRSTKSWYFTRVSKTPRGENENQSERRRAFIDSR